MWRSDMMNGYDRINVIADHFAMGQVLHTVQDSYAHTIRENGTGIIREVKVYSPKGDSATDYRHEGPLTTLFNMWQSHDRIYKYDAGILGLHGKLKAEARAAKSATTELLRLWKNRDQGWLYVSDSDLIKNYFEDKKDPWTQVINSICKHRTE